jgi:hypothetical protein
MFKTLWEYIKNFFEGQAKRVREINEKYSKPRIKMTPLVSVSLIALRIYLFALVGILFFKFFSMLHGK